ncbi:hypothetical protein LY71_1218 [Geodermatophilus tzadiensis]|uniref:Uncharacterized protein n=1 Tax=Geodermatophilus tzadiensis TaxID=1137988 RepID=A0A2T0T111_9ACTN|nr:hypothetical protein [Geodermatophilus tzadiensis]PRY39339.1 hypothetical protein LY71_1218 [Geodermatophilus tzadiensis]
MTALKDDRLAALARRGNVARFVSFSSGTQPALRHACTSAGEVGGDVEAAITAVLLESAGTVNVRSFRPDREKGCPFHYGLASAAEAAALVRSLAADGFFTIVNETVDVRDGGVSGVALGGIVEFAPDDTPRTVEKPGAASLPHDLAVRLLTAVYGFVPEIESADGERLEFSVHPGRVGHRRTHTLWWETEDVDPGTLTAAPSWPNRFSRHLGDKAYGLLMAHSLGLPVPRTTVVGRRVAPFTFGSATGTADHWTRTCPTEQAPGKFTTVPYWTDPFALLHAEDPDGTNIASVLSQEAVDARWSGATIPSGDDRPDHVEGVPGSGDAFMLGQQPPEAVPDDVVADVLAVAALARAVLGPVRLEWAHDGNTAWVVQAHVATHFFRGRGVLSPGDPQEWLDFNAADGLDELGTLITAARRRNAGIRVHGSVGLTSHVGDLLRKAGVPGRLAEA